MNIKKVQSKEWADLKRLIEVVTADKSMFPDFEQNPRGFVLKHTSTLDLDEAVSALYAFMISNSGVKLDMNADTMSHLSDKDNRYIEFYRDLMRSVHGNIERMSNPDRFSNTDFRDWYIRQKKGYFFTSRFGRHMSGQYFVPFSFELADGCSVGCPFCCLDAHRLKDVFLYSESNARLWKDILKISHEIAGDITDSAICYFASEPLDNPDYEHFITDFYELFGRFPQTTTALAQKDITRTKKLIELTKKGSDFDVPLRFSITSLAQLKQIHEEFLPEELADIELTMNNRESVNRYGKSGRARRLAVRIDDKGFEDDMSCVCTNGFVVNLPKKTIRLIAVRNPSDNYPSGYRELEQRSFENADDYRKILEELIAAYMKCSEKSIRLLEGISVTFEAGGMKIAGDGIHRTMSVSAGEKSVFERLFFEANDEYIWRENVSSYERKRIEDKLEIMYRAGYFD